MKKVYFILIACMLITIGSKLSAKTVYIPIGSSFSGLSSTCPTCYISPTGLECTGESTIYADENGYAGITLCAFAPGYTPTSYIWSATWEGSCDRWYIWPNGNHADISVYFTLPQQEGGVVRIECEMYNGSTLIGTGIYYLYVYQE